MSRDELSNAELDFDVVIRELKRRVRCLSCVGEVGPKGVKRARVRVGRTVEPDSGRQRQHPAPSPLGAAENVGVSGKTSPRLTIPISSAT